LRERKNIEEKESQILIYFKFSFKEYVRERGGRKQLKDAGEVQRS